MRGTAVWLIIVLIVVTVFALSNTSTVTVMFWQWPLYTGSLALAVVGAGILGALLAFFSSLLRQTRLSGRIRDLERKLRDAGGPAAEPAAAPAPSAATSASGVRPEDTRRFS